MGARQFTISPGDTYNMLTVISETESKRVSSGGTKRMALCRCVCGSEHVYQIGNLRSGNTKACGAWTCPGSANKRKNMQTPGDFTNRHMCYRSYFFSARRRDLAFDLGEDVWVAITSSRCSYCGAVPSNVYLLKHKDGAPRSGKPYTYNGIDRIDSTKGYVEGNCVACCFTCNRAKSDMPTERFQEWINHIVAYHKEANHVTPMASRQI